MRTITYEPGRSSGDPGQQNGVSFMRRKFMRRKTRSFLVAATVLATGLLFIRPWQPAANAEPGPARSPVTVSFTYDDGSGVQMEAAGIRAG